MFYPLDAGQGSLLRDDTGRLNFLKGSNVVWRTAPAGVRYEQGAETRAFAKVDDPTLLTRPLLMGLAFRLESSLGSRILMSSDEADARIFTLGFASSRLTLKVWTKGSSNVTIQEPAASVVLGQWHMVTAFLGATSSVLRRDGGEIATGTHAARANSLGPRPYLALGVIGNPFNPGNWPNPIQGDIIAVGITPDATVDMIPAFEAKLRGIAAAKGITLP